MQDPIRTQITQLKDRYFRDKPPEGKLNFPTFSPSQTGARGVLIPQVAAGRSLPLDRAVVFQFNPSEVFYRKDMKWSSLERLGYAHEIPYWVSGGARTIAFRLFMDATAGSNFRIFRTNKSTDRSSNVAGGPYINFDDYYLSGSVEGSLGLLPELQKLDAMRYPINKNTNDLVIFKNGVPDVNSLKKFANPPFVLFSYGSVVATTFITQLERRDTLMNPSNNPIRSEVDLVLTVVESRVVDTNIVVQPNLKPAPEQVNDTRRFL